MNDLNISDIITTSQDPEDLFELLDLLGNVHPPMHIDIIDDLYDFRIL